MSDPPTVTNGTPARGKPRRHVVALIALAAGMFGFAFALVPLYETFCEWTGLNGRTAGRATLSEPLPSATDREVTVQFLAQAANGMPWEFRPTQSAVRVQPGRIITTKFYVRNRAGSAVTGQAVPSVAPGQAAPYLNKLECFCFTQQHLDAGAEMEMPVRFYVGTDLPEQIHTLTLSYTLFLVAEPNIGAASQASINVAPQASINLTPRKAGS